PATTQLWVFGASAEGSLGMVRLGLEGDVFTGKVKDNSPAGATPGSDLSGLNLMANAGVMVGPADVGLMVVYGSGQDPEKGRFRTDPTSKAKVNVNSLSPNFVLGNILLYNGRDTDREGSAPNFNGAGILAVKASAGFKNMPMGLPGGDVAVIWARTNEDQILGFDSTTGAPVLNTKHDIGVEIDLNFHHRFDENLMLNVGFGYLFAGDAARVIQPNAAGGTITPAAVAAGRSDNVFQAAAGLAYTF
ncbi:MAG TPA: hypothetical protein VFA47_10650, partial [Candidatus Manganitrophaceae bacterium]|nr:hypothetical protein [Candidatus Manganitrophaceae bacterium]